MDACTTQYVVFELLVDDLQVSVLERNNTRQIEGRWSTVHRIRTNDCGFLTIHHRRLVFSLISQSIESWIQYISRHLQSKPSSTTIRGTNYTTRSSVNDLNAKERNVETPRAHNQPQREDHWADDCVIEDGAALLHKTEDTRGQQRHTTKVCKHKYSQHIEQLHRRLLFLVLSDARLPKHPTLIDYHTSNWGLVPQATAVSHWTPPGLYGCSLNKCQCNSETQV